jgi:hypothetical protein
MMTQQPIEEPLASRHSWRVHKTATGPVCHVRKTGPDDRSGDFLGSVRGRKTGRFCYRTGNTVFTKFWSGSHGFVNPSRSEEYVTFLRVRKLVINDV